MTAGEIRCRMCNGTHWIVMFGGPGNTLKAPCLECNMDGSKPERRRSSPTRTEEGS